MSNHPDWLVEMTSRSCASLNARLPTKRMAATFVTAPSLPPPSLMTYVTNEGAVTKVDAIRFVGNRALSEAQLRDVISTSQSGWFDVLKSAAFYDPERIEQDKDLLRRHYLKQGFPDARVVAAEAVQNPQGTGYTITFTVEEGDRFTFA